LEKSVSEMREKIRAGEELARINEEVVKGKAE